MKLSILFSFFVFFLPYFIINTNSIDTLNEIDDSHILFAISWEVFSFLKVLKGLPENYEGYVKPINPINGLKRCDSTTECILHGDMFGFFNTISCLIDQHYCSPFKYPVVYIVSKERLKKYSIYPYIMEYYETHKNREKSKLCNKDGQISLVKVIPVKFKHFADIPISLRSKFTENPIAKSIIDYLGESRDRKLGNVVDYIERRSIGRREPFNDVHSIRSMLHENINEAKETPIDGNTSCHPQAPINEGKKKLTEFIYVKKDGEDCIDSVMDESVNIPQNSEFADKSTEYRNTLKTSPEGVLVPPRGSQILYSNLSKTKKRPCRCPLGKIRGVNGVFPGVEYSMRFIKESTELSDSENSELSDGENSESSGDSNCFKFISPNDVQKMEEERKFRVRTELLAAARSPKNSLGFPFKVTGVIGCYRLPKKIVSDLENSKIINEEEVDIIPIRLLLSASKKDDSENSYDVTDELDSCWIDERSTDFKNKFMTSRFSRRLAAFFSQDFSTLKSLFTDVRNYWKKMLCDYYLNRMVKCLGLDYKVVASALKSDQTMYEDFQRHALNFDRDRKSTNFCETKSCKVEESSAKAILMSISDAIKVKLVAKPLSTLQLPDKFLEGQNGIASPRSSLRTSSEIRG